MKTLAEGYINRNNQKNLGYRGKSETHYNQNFFEMECLDCGHKYMANGCDVWLRKCPVCNPVRKKGGKPESHTASALNVSKNFSPRKISDKLRYMDYVKEIKTNALATVVKLADLKHNSDLTRADVVDENMLSRVEKYKEATELLPA